MEVRNDYIHNMLGLPSYCFAWFCGGFGIVPLLLCSFSLFNILGSFALKKKKTYNIPQFGYSKINPN
jgi:hypothetical protein